MMKIACLPGFVKSTRTCHLPSAVVAVKVHGVVESHLPLTWCLATSIAPSLSRAAAHGGQEAKTAATTAATARLGIIGITICTFIPQLADLPSLSLSRK